MFKRLVIGALLLLTANLINAANVTVEYRLIGGGAGGGDGSVGGGGGAGGYITDTTQVTAGASYAITIGAGGAHAANGVDSVFAGVKTATGGGKGGTQDTVGTAGGSGGGGSWNRAGGAGTSGQGLAGGAGTQSGNFLGGGGGGAGAVGSDYQFPNGGPGGTGLSSSITGSATTLACGGGGGGYDALGSNANAAGGCSSAGNGTYVLNSDGAAASANTGSGGGGAAAGIGVGGAGGSGRFDVRYLTANYNANGTGGTISTIGAYTLHSFTSNGTFVAPTLRNNQTRAMKIRKNLRMQLK